jgi:hypothetical protein
MHEEETTSIVNSCRIRLASVTEDACDHSPRERGVSIDPYAFLRDAMRVARHPMSRIDELQPFAYLPAQAEKAAP